MKRYRILFCLFTLTVTTLSAYPQKDRNESLIRSALHGLEYQVKAGISIGGTAPIPLPVQIRSIDSYNPTLATSIEGEVTKWLSSPENLGITVGIRLENKAMITKATVRSYNMEILGTGGEKISGVWTGGVKTEVSNTYLTFPVLATYKLSERWRMKAGPYFSYLISGDFSGNVYEGYLREGSPIGPKVSFTDGKTATYDFSDNLRRFQWGAQIEAEWRAFKHLNVYANLTWGLNDIFKSDFHTITFAMYPIFMNIGFAYAF